MALTEELKEIDELCDLIAKYRVSPHTIVIKLSDLARIKKLVALARADRDRLADKLATAVEALDGARCFKSCPCVRCDEIDAALDKIKESSNG